MNHLKSLAYLADDYINIPSYNLTQDFQETKDMFQNMVDNSTIETEYKQTEIFVQITKGILTITLIFNTPFNSVLSDFLVRLHYHAKLQKG
jgi:hypothetical protein